MKPVHTRSTPGDACRLVIHEPSLNARRSGAQRREPGYEILCGEGHQHLLDIRPAIQTDEREAVFRLRHDAYCGPGKDLPAQPDGLEQDVYDEGAILEAARMEGVLVGTIRVIFPREGKLLIEELGQPLPPHLSMDCTSEISRIVVDRLRLPMCVYTPLISVALYHRARFDSLQVGQENWVFDANPKSLRTIRRMRWNIASLGPALEHHGQRFEPFSVSLAAENFTWELAPDD